MRADRNFRMSVFALGLMVFWVSLIAAAGASLASTFTVLHSFGVLPRGGTDGAFPTAPLLADRAGNLYGTTTAGGAGMCNVFGPGCGVVFKLRPPVPPATQWAYRVLYSFSGDDGGGPLSALIIDSKGNLYGTTYFGGPQTAHCNLGCGVVFKLAPPVSPSTQWTESVLYAFTGLSDGGFPSAPLVIDKNENLYGTTSQGGIAGGVVFKLAPPVPPATQWTETVLYSFMGGSDGGGPTGGLITDRTGNLYGTTPYGGTYECGTVFKLAPPVSPSTQWTETVLYAFTGTLVPRDGCAPYAGVIADSRGNLYGTTKWGAGAGRLGTGTGGVFKLRPDGKEGFWFPFHGTDGLHPAAGLSADDNGNLYGTTLEGGPNYATGLPGAPRGNGVIFKLAPDRTETVLYSFGSGAFPQSNEFPFGPTGGVIVDSAGNLYGTTVGEGTFGSGVVYELTP